MFDVHSYNEQAYRTKKTMLQPFDTINSTTDIAASARQQIHDGAIVGGITHHSRRVQDMRRLDGLEFPADGRSTMAWIQSNYTNFPFAYIFSNAHSAMSTVRASSVCFPGTTVQ